MTTEMRQSLCSLKPFLLAVWRSVSVLSACGLPLLPGHTVFGTGPRSWHNGEKRNGLPHRGRTYSSQTFRSQDHNSYGFQDAQRAFVYIACTDQKLPTVSEVNAGAPNRRVHSFKYNDDKPTACQHKCPFLIKHCCLPTTVNEWEEHCFMFCLSLMPGLRNREILLLLGIPAVSVSRGMWALGNSTVHLGSHEWNRPRTSSSC